MKKISVNLILVTIVSMYLFVFSAAFAADKVVVIPMTGTTKYHTMDWLGEWTNGINYEIGDGVQKDGSSYMCIAGHTAIESENGPPNDVFWSLFAAVGDEGPQGEIGPAGPQGEIGDTGPQGIQGVKGDTGATGLRGAVGDRGPKGDKGDTGPVGSTGPTGDRGPTGEKGDVGPQGERGPTGEQGPQGDIGPQGPQGESGLSAAGWRCPAGYYVLGFLNDGTLICSGDQDPVPSE
jgi:hypothetical protein